MIEGKKISPKYLLNNLIVFGGFLLLLELLLFPPAGTLAY